MRVRDFQQRELAATDLKKDVLLAAKAAREAAHRLTKTTAPERNRALLEIADSVRATKESILAANQKDMEAGQAKGLSSAMLDRLRLDEARVEGIANAVAEVAKLPDLIGRVESTETRPNGLIVQRVRIPLGVIAMIYEARPNVTTDAAALCLKAGNACILRGGSEAFHSNHALGSAIGTGLERAGLPSAVVQVMKTTDREGMRLLLQQEEEIDLVIPRGGEGLIRFVSEHSRIPVLKHYKGVCHVYIHEGADQDAALLICENAKVQRPGVCNAVETILVDKSIAAQFVPKLVSTLAASKVEIRGDERARSLDERIVAAQESDWDAEYLDLIVALRVVDDLDGAINHIAEHGSNHTESIITTDETAAERFLAEVQSSTVMVNASTRFADGGELGLGAEIGISTTKMHAYGPMGAEGLTATKFVVRGTGQVRK
jgi:glutamate-5-semialdehyde dehydrogenase